jgi:site-specific DNA recombinase
MTRNAVVYVRVSTAEQVENYSLETQRSSCIEFCNRHGWNVLEVFSEEGVSAKTANRPQLNALIDYCIKNSKSVDYLVVYKLDRLTRQLMDFTQIRAELQRLGIAFRATQETFDDSPMGNFAENMVASMAQFDNQVRAARTREGMRKAAEYGRWILRVPLGYVRLSKDADPSLTHDAVRAPLIRTAFEMVSSGTRTQREVLAHVTALGLRTLRGKPLSNQTFNSILQNRVYAGFVVIKKWNFETKGDFEPIVSEELFNRVQDVLAGRSVQSGRVRDNDDFPLRRFVRCGKCNTPMTGSWSTSRSGKKYPYYHCRKDRCDGTNIRKDRLEELFVDQLRQINVREETIDLLDASVEDLIKERTAEARSALTDLNSRLEDLRAARLRLVDAYVDHKIDEQTYDERKAMFDSEIDVIERQVERSQVKDIDVAAVMRFARSHLLDLPGCWNQLESGHKQGFQRVMFPNGLSYCDGAVGTSETSWLFPQFMPETSNKKVEALPTGFEPVSPP